MIAASSSSVSKVHRVVMFDWDNTLMASADFLYQVHLRTAQILGGQDIDLKKKIPKVATKKREAILIDLFGKENLPHALTVFNKVYTELFKVEALQMLPGAKILLEKLVDTNYSIAIVSNYTEVGIKEHLTVRKMKHDNLVIVGVDTLKENKPSLAPGKYVLEQFQVDTAQPVQILMIGDGLNSDMSFAKNMHQYLQKLNPNSYCKGILFNSLLDGDSIYDDATIQAFLQKQQPAGWSKATVRGHACLFATIRNHFNPGWDEIHSEITHRAAIKN